MNRKPGLPIALWQIGLLLIVAGVAANVVMDVIGSSAPAGSAQARGEAFGRGLVTLLFGIAGVVLIVVHFVRLAQRGANIPNVVHSPGVTGGNPTGQYIAIGAGIGGGLLVTVLLIIFFVAGRSRDDGKADSIAMKPRKEYPVSIAVPEHSVLVPAKAKLKAGTKLEACWVSKWNPITTLSENRGGSVNVRWDEFGETYDCSMVRSELIIKWEVLKELRLHLRKIFTLESRGGCNVTQD